ncbi:MAG: hypothetical protein WAK90_22905 [Pseudolabrys sp.]
MSLRRIQIPPAVAAEGKRQWEETNIFRQDIAAGMGISPDTLRRRSIEWGWKERPRRSPVRAFRPAGATPGRFAARHHQAGSAGDSAAAARRRAVALRIMAMLEDELARIETTFKEAGVSAGGAFDNRIRAILGVTRALREVELMSKPDEVIPPDAADNDTPRNIDEFRDALARRIESFVAAQQNADGGTDGGAAG